MTETLNASFALHHRVALITGAGRGIGFGIACGLSAAGASVVVQDIDLAAAQKAVEELIHAGGRAAAIGGDINDIESAARLVDQTTQKFGALHIVVNNASIQVERPWLEESPDEVLAQYRSNIVFPIELVKHAAPILRRQQWGRVINIGSIHQKGPWCAMLGYGLTKVAIEGLTRALARDFVKDGVTVNLLAPGYFDSHRNADQFPNTEAEIEAGRRAVPMGRIGKPHDVAGIAVSLCSDACSYITGQTIYVDGGMSVR